MLCFASCGSGNGSGGDGNTGKIEVATSGALDANFGTGGIVRTGLGSFFSQSTTLVIQVDGKIVVMGGSMGAYTLARYHSDGSLDHGFGNGGVATMLPAVNGGYPNGLALQPDGKIIVVGSSYNGTDNDINVVRFLADGSVDAAWGNRGQLISSVGTDEVAYGVAVQPDGKVLVVGFAPNGIDNDFLLVRFNSDGSLDATFGLNGIVKTSFRPRFAVMLGASANHVAILADGKIVVAGSVLVAQQFSSQVDGALVRYLNNGTVDATFGLNGYVTNIGGGFGLSGFLMQRDGKICVSTYDGGYSGSIYRYSTNGSLDMQFGQGGTISSNSSPYLALDSQGRIVAAGQVFNGTSNIIEVTRYLQDGGLDSSFGAGGKVLTYLSSYDYPTTVIIQDDGKILVAGSTNDPGGSVVILRYEP